MSARDDQPSQSPVSTDGVAMVDTTIRCRSCRPCGSVAAMVKRLFPALLVVTTLAIGSFAAPAEAKTHRPKYSAGHYVGTEAPEQPNGFDDIVFAFDVRTKGGTVRIRNFTMAMNVVCSGFPLYTEYVVQPMHTIRVSKKTGRFRDTVSGSTEDGTTYRVKVAGRLKGKKVTAATMSYDVGICQRGTGDDGPVRWTARKKRA